MEGFCEVVPRLHSDSVPFSKTVETCPKTQCLVQEDFENTYWSSSISSRVRVNNREWMSGLESTVSGILAT